MSASRPDFLFPHWRCVPRYPLVDDPTIPKYYFKLSKVSFLSHQVFALLTQRIVAFRKCFLVLESTACQHHDTLQGLFFLVSIKYHLRLQSTMFHGLLSVSFSNMLFDGKISHIGLNITVCGISLYMMTALTNYRSLFGC